MAKNSKMELHFFTLTDYEKEEEFLRKKSNEGYRFKKVVAPCFYFFEKAEPEDVIYRLDFNPKSKEEKEDFFQMYCDYGWEYIQDLNCYSYFRRPAKDTSEAEGEIFSDNASRLEMLKSIVWSRFIPILVVFLLIAVPNIINIFDFTRQFIMAYRIFWGTILVLYGWMFIDMVIGVYKLKEKYSV